VIEYLSRNRRKIGAWALIAVLVLIVAGGGLKWLMPSRDSAREIRRDGLDIVLDHAVGVGFVFKDEQTKERFCRTPGPDFASGTGGGFNIDTGQGPKIGVSDSYNAMSMGGRSPDVLIMRELLYRACELAMNANASPEQTLEIYKFFINEGQKFARVNPSGATSSASVTSETSKPAESK
jgi:hypothetical protein